MCGGETRAKRQSVTFHRKFRVAAQNSISHLVVACAIRKYFKFSIIYRVPFRWCARDVMLRKHYRINHLIDIFMCIRFPLCVDFILLIKAIILHQVLRKTLTSLMRLARILLSSKVPSRRSARCSAETEREKKTQQTQSLNHMWIPWKNIDFFSILFPLSLTYSWCKKKQNIIKKIYKKTWNYSKNSRRRFFFKFELVLCTFLRAIPSNPAIYSMAKIPPLLIALLRAFTWRTKERKIAGKEAARRREKKNSKK